MGVNRQRRKSNRQPRRIRVRGVRRERPDIRKLSRALLEIAQAEVDARLSHDRGEEPKAGVGDAPDQ